MISGVYIGLVVICWVFVVVFNGAFICVFSLPYVVFFRF